MAAKKKQTSDLGPVVYLTLKVGENQLDVSGSYNYVLGMRDWFIETLESRLGLIHPAAPREPEE